MSSLFLVGGSVANTTKVMVKRLCAILLCWRCLAVASGIELTSSDQEWIHSHPVVRYGVLLPDSMDKSRDEVLALAVGYMDALCARAGLVERFQPMTANDEAWGALMRGDVDALVVAAALLQPSEKTLPIRVSGNLPWLAEILERSHRSFTLSDLEALPRMAVGEASYSQGRISGRQFVFAVLTLAAGSTVLVVLVWLWARLRRRGLAREAERNAALFDAFFLASPTGMAILDRELRFVRVNQPLAALHGAAADEHLGRTVGEVVPDLADIIVPLMREVLMSDRSAHNIELSWRTVANPQLESHWLVSLFPISVPDARYPMGIGVVVLDIGDRKRAELALRESENRLRNISDHLPVAVFQYRSEEDGLSGDALPSGGFTYLSDGIARILHLDRLRLFEQPASVVDCVHPEDRASLLATIAQSKRLPAPHGEIEWTGRLATSDETGESWVQVRATLELPFSGGFSVSGVVLDVSQLKRIQLALERSRAELRYLGAHREAMVEREYQRLAREFHDELGQLLTTARMHLQLLTRLMDSDLEQARISVQTIDAMIVDAYRSIKSIASDLRPPALNLGLAAAIEWLVVRMLHPLGIACSVDCAPEADRLGDVVSIALFRIVQESLTNIVRHAQAARVIIQVRSNGDDLSLRVADDGKGFDAGLVDRARQFGLLGISERVAALGGELVLNSEPGQGTTVEVVLHGLSCQSIHSFKPS